MAFSRRQLLKTGLLGAPAFYLACTSFTKNGLTNTATPLTPTPATSASNLPPSPPSTPFQAVLPAAPPPGALTPDQVQALTPAGFTPVPGTTLAPPAIDADFYLIVQKKAPQQIFPSGSPTIVWGYNGQFPGPTIVAQQGRTVVVRQVNALDEANTFITHLHGGHTPSVYDGAAFSDQIVPPGSFKDYIYPNDNPFGCTLWYHDHSIDFTGRNINHGLAAFYLLKDAFEQNLVSQGLLPSPQFDIPLALQDRQFDANNQIVYNAFDHDGFLGDTFLVNGAIQPRMTVANRRYRFRILCGTNARFFGLNLSTGEPFTIIASDQSLLPHPVVVDKLAMAPAERYEIIIDFSKHNIGDSVILQNVMAQTDGRHPDGFDFSNPVPLVRFDVGIDNPEINPQPIPDPLRSDLVLPQLADVVQVREFDFQRSDGAWQINGQFYDENRVDATPKVGTTELWKLSTGGGWAHPIHIHAEGHRVLDRNGNPPPPWEAGLKDTTVLDNHVDPYTTEVNVLISFTKNTGKYVMHCHNAEHEDMRMMTRFDIQP